MGVAWLKVTAGAIGIIGLLGAIVCCALPRWQEFTGKDAHAGLWMVCQQQQCEFYPSELVIPPFLHAARAMTIISCIFTGVSLLLLLVTCVHKDNRYISLAAGLGFFLGGTLLIIPASWGSHTIRQNNGNWQNPNMKMGACIYVGWLAGVLLQLGGGCASRR